MREVMVMALEGDAGTWGYAATSQASRVSEPLRPPLDFRGGLNRWSMPSSIPATRRFCASFIRAGQCSYGMRLRYDQ